MALSKLEKPTPISLTTIAAAEIRNILQVKGIPADYFLRVGTSGGGCAGVSYIIGFDKQGLTDEVYSIEGIKVLIDKKHALFLWGLEVDFIEGVERGFIFNANKP